MVNTGNGQPAGDQLPVTAAFSHDPKWPAVDPGGGARRLADMKFHLSQAPLPLCLYPLLIDQQDLRPMLIEISRNQMKTNDGFIFELPMVPVYGLVRV